MNCLRHYTLPHSALSLLDGEILRVASGEELCIRVHSRQPADGRKAGMLSCYLVHPRKSRLSYRLQRLTSHFGCGHIEIAFYELEPDRVKHGNCKQCAAITLYAVRNILKSNRERLRRGDARPRLPLGDEKSEVAVVVELIALMRQHGFPVSFAEPEQCIELAVTPTLVHPDRLEETRTSLLRKYKRLWRQCRLETGTVQSDSQVLSAQESTSGMAAAS